MGKMIVSILSWAMNSFANRILTSIGFSILGSISFSVFIEYFVNKSLNQFADIPFLGLIGLAGIDKAISIILSAVFLRAYLSTVLQSLKIVRK